MPASNTKSTSGSPSAHALAAGSVRLPVLHIGLLVGPCRSNITPYQMEGSS